MNILYYLIVLYISLNLLVYIFREKKTVWQISASVLLLLFLLRILLIK